MSVTNDIVPNKIWASKNSEIRMELAQLSGMKQAITSIGLLYNS